MSLLNLSFSLLQQIKLLNLLLEKFIKLINFFATSSISLTFCIQIYINMYNMYIYVTTFLGSSIRPNPWASLTENAVSTHDVIVSGTVRRNSVFPSYLQEHILLLDFTIIPQRNKVFRGYLNKLFVY